MIDIRVVDSVVVEVHGKKGDTCVSCNMLPAEYVFWEDTTHMSFVCSFCETGKAIQGR